MTQRICTLVVGLAGLSYSWGLQAQEPVVPLEDLELRYKKMDTDHDGIVTIIDYLGKKRGPQEAKAKELFAKMDKNKDGFLMFKEYRDYMTPKKPKKE